MRAFYLDVDVHAFCDQLYQRFKLRRLFTLAKIIGLQCLIRDVEYVDDFFDGREVMI